MKFADSLGKKLLRANPALLFLLLFLTLLAKTGIHVETANIAGSYLPTAQNFPKLTAYFSASIGDNLLAKILHVTTVAQWIYLHILLIGICFATIYMTSLKFGKGASNAFMIYMFSLSATASLLMTIGKYDPITFIGATILASGSSSAQLILGSAIMCLGNPEMSVVAALLTKAISYDRDFRHLKHSSNILLTTTIIYCLAINMLLIQSGVQRSRATLIPFYALQSLVSVVQNPLRYTYFLYGITWIVLLIALHLLIRNSGSVRPMLLGGFIAIPLVFTFITADGTRVFSLITMPITIYLYSYLFNYFKLGDSTNRLAPTIIGWYFIAWLILPGPNSSLGLLSEGAISSMTRLSTAIQNSYPLR